MLLRRADRGLSRAAVAPASLLVGVLRTIVVAGIVSVAGCTNEAPPTRPPGPCTILRVASPGPRAAERALTTDPLEIATIYLQEARDTADAGFYTLADQAVSCALETGTAEGENSTSAATTRAARRLQAQVWIQLHRFADAERVMRELLAEGADGEASLILGDALMEQGRLDEAGALYQAVADTRPGAAVYDRVAWLRWLWGDVEGARELHARAATASPPGSEGWAWSMTHLGWWKLLSGEPAPEIVAVLALLPDYAPARIVRARQHLFEGQPDAARAALEGVPRTFEVSRLLTEIPTLEPSSAEAVERELRSACALDARGCAAWLAPIDPERALRLMEKELKDRQDATTHMVHAWALHHADALTLNPTRTPAKRAAAEAALATGILEPRVLLFGGIILDKPDVIARALAMGPGLLPSEHARGQAALALISSP